MKNIATNPGDRRHQVQIQQRSSTNVGGCPSDTWTTIRETWARITSTALSEKYQGGQFSGQGSYIVNVRWSPIEILPGMRVVSGAHVYTIQDPYNCELRGIELNMLCIEIDGGSDVA